MIDQRRASQLAKEGFDLWQSNRPEEAVSRYQEALALADQDHYGLPTYHGEFAGVLATLGRYAEAREQYQLALASEIRLAPDSVGINVNRYFLAELPINTGDPSAALDVLLPGLSSGGKFEWVLRMSEAEAYWKLGDTEQARKAAKRSLDLAPSDVKRTEMHDRLAPILEDERA